MCRGFGRKGQVRGEFGSARTLRRASAPDGLRLIHVRCRARRGPVGALSAPKRRGKVAQAAHGRQGAPLHRRGARPGDRPVVVFLYRHLNGNLDVLDPTDQLSNRPAAVEVEGPQDPLNVLVMGSDTRDGAGNNIDGLTGGGERSDTTILLHVSADR